MIAIDKNFETLTPGLVFQNTTNIFFTTRPRTAILIATLVENSRSYKRYRERGKAIKIGV